MSPTPENRSQRPWRWVLLLALLALGGVVGWLLSREQPAPAAPVTQVRTRTPPSPEQASSPVLAAAPKPPEAADAPATAEPKPPIVDEILVEKQEVCSGEDNLITVRAHTPDGNDAYLHYTVGDGTGQRIPIRVWRNDADGSYELPRVTVFTKDNVSVTVPLPPYRVKDCEPERLIHVMSRRQPNSEDDVEFFAKLVERPVLAGQPAPKPFVPVRFVWTFDDEAPVTTTGPIVSHSMLSNTGASSMYTQHLIRVDAYDAAGRKETGRSSLQMLNTSFENFDKKGIVTLLAVGSPRFPVLDPDGVVRQTFRLYHRFRGPVRITQVKAVRAFRGNEDSPPPPEQVDVASLSVSEVPEGKGAEVQVSFDTKAEPDVFAITYALEGVSSEGHPARGTFSVMRPPPRPTKETSTPITDPVLLAKVKRAREILQQEFVTDEDIFRLEREGKFAGLQVEKPSGEVAPASGTLNGRPRNPAR
ncbi:hypothetical protein BO221_08185 [Archangium sp. Cb G35]|uniref:hypothetical protein n=1 Tax=Archangium sp. Cb G35 TaxID=1920190 RepID=UPI00095C59D6|nr:hypothetical protein [Archangium sp. Cb G35]OJT25819.1 hypothetical protein BO221_08185 [Archangium sp. Cb G35]